MAKKPPPPSPQGESDWHQLRLWQIQPIRDLLLIAAIFGILYLGYVLSIVTVPILLALTLAYLFEPLVQAILRRTSYLGRQGVAALIIILASLVVIVPTVIGIGFGVVQGANAAAKIATRTNNLVTSVQGDETQRADALEKLPPHWKAASHRIQDLKQEVDSYRASRQPTAEGEDPKEIESWKVNLYNIIDISINWVRANAAAIGKTLSERAIGTGASAVSVAGKTLGSLGVLLFTAFLTAFFFFFFCTGWGRVLAFWEGLIPERKKNRVIDLLLKMDRVIAGFIRGRLIICAVLGAFVTIMYFIIGVPVPLILGPIVGLFFLVPFMHVIAMPMAMLALWLEPSDVKWQATWWWIIFAPIGVNLLCQILDDYVLTPMIQGKNTDMSTPSILFASIAGGTLAGFYGLLLAIPAAACIKIILREVFMPRFEAWAKGREKDFLPIGRDDPSPH
jgi:predicted PurR-regulated permease PerM